MSEMPNDRLCNATKTRPSDDLRVYCDGVKDHENAHLAVKHGAMPCTATLLYCWHRELEPGARPTMTERINGALMAEVRAGADVIEGAAIADARKAVREAEAALVAKDALVASLRAELADAHAMLGTKGLVSE